MSDPHPSLRTVFARVLTPAGWIHGDFHAPAAQNFLDFLEHGGPIYKLTRAIRPGNAVIVPFIALRREHVILIVPAQSRQELGLDQGEPTVPHAVSMLFHDGTLSGELEVPRPQRVSDFLMLHSGFVPLSNCTSPGATHSGKPNFRAPLALVNTSRLIAVSEDNTR